MTGLVRLFGTSFVRPGESKRWMLQRWRGIEVMAGPVSIWAGDDTARADMFATLRWRDLYGAAVLGYMVDTNAQQGIETECYRCVLGGDGYMYTTAQSAREHLRPESPARGLYCLCFVSSNGIWVTPKQCSFEQWKVCVRVWECKCLSPPAVCVCVGEDSRAHIHQHAALQVAGNTCSVLHGESRTSKPSDGLASFGLWLQPLAVLTLEPGDSRVETLLRGRAPNMSLPNSGKQWAYKYTRVAMFDAAIYERRRKGKSKRDDEQGHEIYASSLRRFL